jgi:hypothetical protein
MPIKWSPVEVSEAMDKIEAEVNKAVPYLEQARAIAREAKGIKNLPLYSLHDLNRFLGEIERSIGGSSFEPTGRLKAAIKGVRDSIPDGAIEAERQAHENGKTERLM